MNWRAGISSRFLCWLWCAPLFLMLYTGLITHGTASGHRSEVALGHPGRAGAGLFIDALNREGAGPSGKKSRFWTGLKTAD